MHSYISVAGHFDFTWNRAIEPNARVFIHIEQIPNLNMTKLGLWSVYTYNEIVSRNVARHN
jgi:hypothetical protein